ncbi:MAG: cyclic nucleotide-binding domain-containing protein [Anaerolineae bacterium]|nr:cyclic nucleotide-binding domain-containing protein [Anaerolineae bacterium]
MPDRFIATHVRQLPLFAPIPDELLQHTLSAMQILRYEAGETVFKIGEASKGMYLLIDGQADLIRKDEYGNDIRIGSVGANQFLNEQSLYQKKRESATLIVRQPANILLISRGKLWDVVAQYPEIKQYIPVPVAEKIKQEQQAIAEFDGQRPNETVLLETRRHWWAFIQKGWLPALLFGVGLMIYAFVPIVVVQIIGCGFLGLFVPAVLMIYHYVEWRNDSLIITSQRVIHIERTILSLSANKSEIALARIHQVNVEINPRDPMARLFRYGSVELRTAGDAGNIIIHTLPRVDDIQEVIFDHRAKLPEADTTNRKEEIRAEIERVLAGDNKPQSSDNQKKSSSPQKVFAPLRSKFINSDGDTVYRHHQIVWWRGMFRPALLIIGALLVLVFGSTWGLGAFTGIIGMALFFGALFWTWWIDWDWRNDLYIIGDSRIKLIRKRPLWLQNKDDHILMESIDNVTSEKGGILQNIFNYGDVQISLIGGDRGDEKWLYAVPNPQAIQAEITRRQERRRNYERETNEKQRKQEIAEYLAVYHEMQQNNNVGGGADFPRPPLGGNTPTGYNSNTRPPGVPRKKS